MSQIRTPDGLEIDENPGQQRLSWVVQRIGWGVMALVIASSVMGALGGRGPASTTRAGEPGSALVVEYERMLRTHAPAEFRVVLGAGDTEPAFTLDEAFLAGLEVQSVVPQPLRVECGDGVQRYVFASAGTGGAVRVVIRAQALRPGTRRGFVGVGAQRVEVSQFVYP